MSGVTAAQYGVHGGLVQRIVAAGRGRTYPSGAGRLVKDRFLRTLMRRGVLTAERVEQAVNRYNAAPASYLWIAGVSRGMLAVADCVFLAEFGRFPAGDDLQLNGSYHKICRGLEYDPHYYDKQLQKLRWDQDGRPYVRCQDSRAALREVREVDTRRGNAWLFGLALVVGVVGGPAIAALMARNVSADPVSALYVFGVVWISAFAGLLTSTRPRRVRRRNTVLKCGRCDREFDPERRGIGCPTCGVLFEG